MFSMFALVFKMLKSVNLSYLFFVLYFMFLFFISFEFNMKFCFFVQNACFKPISNRYVYYIILSYSSWSVTSVAYLDLVIHVPIIIASLVGSRIVSPFLVLVYHLFVQRF